MAVVQEIKKLNEKFEKRPGVPASMEEAAPESNADSPFIDERAKVDLPKTFVIPSMRTYDGTSDLQNHVAFYKKKKILAASIPSEFRQWYINLPIGSIRSFVDLINTFNQQFASSRELEKRSSDLYRITQKSDETLRVFFAKFNKEKVSIPRYDIGTAVEAFRKGLLPNSDLYGELTKYPCHSFEDIQPNTLAYIRLEEVKSYKVGGPCNVKDYDKPNWRSAGRGYNYKTGPYTRPDQLEVNLVQEQLDSATG
ncbi:uncharacterized protein LOC141620175 [Silene latifolia]|uniref:uncharacterized protein LOC141620175 n=1 Tax=Silene latifolia TaxID=37657 RepID=UPI003D77F5B3